MSGVIRPLSGTFKGGHARTKIIKHGRMKHNLILKKMFLIFIYPFSNLDRAKPTAGYVYGSEQLASRNVTNQ